MDVLKRIVSDFLLNPSFLTMAAAVVFVVVWGPVVEHTEGFIARLLRRSKPRWDLAVDVQRGQWHVRVTEASVRVANPSGYGVRWEQEHRIAVATARMAPMRVIRPSKYTSSGKPLTHAEIEKLWSRWPADTPSTARHDHVAWQRVPIAPPMDQEFFVYGSRPRRRVQGAELRRTALAARPGGRTAGRGAPPAADVRGRVRVRRHDGSHRTGPADGRGRHDRRPARSHAGRAAEASGGCGLIPAAGDH